MCGRPELDSRSRVLDPDLNQTVRPTVRIRYKFFCQFINVAYAVQQRFLEFSGEIGYIVFEYSLFECKKTKQACLTRGLLIQLLMVLIAGLD